MGGYLSHRALVEGKVVSGRDPREVRSVGNRVAGKGNSKYKSHEMGA